MTSAYLRHIRKQKVSCVGHNNKDDFYYDKVLTLYKHCKKNNIPICIKDKCKDKQYLHIHLYKKDYDKLVNDMKLKIKN